MKTIFLSIISFFSTIIVFAQDSTAKAASLSQQSIDGDVDNSLSSGSIESVLPIIAITLAVLLIIQVTKYILDHKLRNKIIDRTISEQLANSILQKSAADKKDESVKWSILLLSLSGGLTVAYHTMPLHIHSLAIMAFSAGISYLIYFFYLQKKNK
jgi:predicted AAA+ superfamily ATPase